MSNEQVLGTGDSLVCLGFFIPSKFSKIISICKICKVRKSLTQVVLVCINFRLSVLGGLYIPGGKAPGNQMMRDQVRQVVR